MLFELIVLTYQILKEIENVKFLAVELLNFAAHWRRMHILYFRYYWAPTCVISLSKSFSSLGCKGKVRKMVRRIGFREIGATFTQTFVTPEKRNVPAQGGETGSLT